MAPAKTMNEHQLAIIHLTRDWLGTPYHHQQSLKGHGCDCLGLVRGVFEEYYQTKTQPIPPYSREWADVSKTETLINAAAEHLIRKEPAERTPGDVLLFRFRRWMVAKHAGILVTPATMIHAIEGAKVSEVHVGPWWQRHLAAVFAFPSKEQSKMKD